ncbi:MAG TPA: porin family protein, partial [Flavobacteriaceae bacterium]|nr:porin family protein [Flavobacteriaceae bacterium]
MKKIILTIVIAALTMVSVNAQSFGLKAGVNMSTFKVSDDGYDVSTEETGFYIGAFTDIFLNETLKLQPGVNYVSVSDAELDMIQVPVALKFEIADNFNLLAGPNFGFILDQEEGAKDFNLALDFGLSYYVVPNFFIETRYNLGLTNLIDDEYEEFAGYDITGKLHG